MENHKQVESRRHEWKAVQGQQSGGKTEEPSREIADLPALKECLSFLLAWASLKLVL